MARVKQLMGIAEVAEYLKLNPVTLHRYARRGVIPAFKIGNRWKFYRHQIHKWLVRKKICRPKITF